MGWYIEQVRFNISEKKKTYINRSGLNLELYVNHFFVVVLRAAVLQRSKEQYEQEKKCLTRD